MPLFKLASRGRDGRYKLRLPGQIRESIGSGMDELRRLLLEDDVLLYRLFPPAYAEDPERSAGYAALAKPELVDRHLAHIETVESTLDADSLDEEQFLAWMQAVNALRLVLGTLLDISDDEDPRVTGELEPAWHLYQLLSVILEHLVAAISD